MKSRKNKGNRLFLHFATAALAVSLIPFLLLPRLPTLALTTTPNRADPEEAKGASDESSVHRSGSEKQSTTSPDPWEESCAICFFGLPRSFKLLVLPSMIKNVLNPNKRNKCDIYLHYYHLEEETGGRSGYGGSISPRDVWLLKDAVKMVYDGVSASDVPFVSITMDTNESFLKKRGKLLQKFQSARDSNGQYLYFPWMAKSYTYPTSIDNIVMQWHSIQSSWEDMQQNAIALRKNYSRVAMMRNDVVYVTPFDIYQISNDTRDEGNRYAVVPNWARFPINDRMIYGPHDGVKIWATERFKRLEDHVLTYEEPGYGMHSERFLNHSIFPAIRELGINVVANPEICFFRARADGSTWINDCTTRDGAAKGFRKKNAQSLVESIVGRTCRKSKFNAKTIQLHCNDEMTKNHSIIG